MAEDWESAGFGLYLHWPFCQAKCPYCDFNSHVAREIDESQWKRAYLSEIDRVAAETTGRELRSVFFGGGTPSLMSADLVGAIMDRIAARWRLSDDVEVTLEANPTSVEAGRFQGYAMAGVNRVSLGVQALNDGDLRRLGRLHSAAEARAAIDVARGVFSRVSFDLIYARQDQSLDAWRLELDSALAFKPDHLSLYQLTIEEGTAFGDRAAAGRLSGMPDDDLGADMYALTQDLLELAGLPAYEVSNHAALGQASRHNLIYWRGGDWGGIGPGAHGRLTLEGKRWATETVTVPLEWLRKVGMHGSGESLREVLSADAVAVEAALMGLRLVEGIDADRFRRLSLGVFDMNIKYLVEAELMALVNGRLLVTKAGMPLLNSILGKLLDTQSPDRARSKSSS